MSRLLISQVVFLLFLLSAGAKADWECTVNTTTGSVVGQVLDGCTQPAKVWLGIPYAQPPVGSLRFKPPVPVVPWSGVLNATTQPNACYQKSDLYSGNDLLEITNETMSEDCLYLNIVAPYFEECDHDLMPVLVWFSFGGFGRGSISSPAFDMQCLSVLGNAVVVTMNYRLSGLGFLRIDDDTAAGNMGLLDQQLALKWIHDNIEQFGGDPNKITLIGHSPGSIAVSMHLASPGSQGLFKNAILMSGSPSAAGSVDSQAKALEKAQQLGASLGCPTNDNNALFNCLQSQDPNDLVVEEGSNIITVFQPTIDGVFLTDTVQNVLATKNLSDLSVIIGNTFNDGNSYAFMLLEEVFGISQTEIPNLNETVVVPFIASLLTEGGFDPSNAQTIYDYYYNQTNNSFQAISLFIADFGVNCRVNDFSRLLFERGANVFKYVFNHESNCTSWGRYYGITRAEDLFYVLGSSYQCKFPIQFACIEKSLSLGIILYFTQFARTNVPCTSWKPYSLPKECYLDISLPVSTIQSGYRLEQCTKIKQILS